MSNWNFELRSLGQELLTSSDEFLANDEMICLFQGERPVAAFMTRYLLLDSIAYSRISKWTNFGAENLGRLSNLGLRRVEMLGGFVVGPEFRREKSGGTISRILANMVAFKTKNSRAIDALVSVTRNNRGVNSLGMAIGGQRVGETSVFGIASDVVIVQPENARLCPVTNFSEEELLGLWISRVVHNSPILKMEDLRNGSQKDMERDIPIIGKQLRSA